MTTTWSLKPGQPTWKPQYPGFPTQTYRIGDHLYSTGGSEAQKPPNRMTHCKHVYQWQTEHFNQVAASQRDQAQGATDRAASRATVSFVDKQADDLNALSTVKIGDKIDATDALNNDLKKTLADLENELKLLDTCMADTQAGIDSKKEPLDAVNYYIRLRATRLYGEKLCDPEKLALEKMLATLNESVRLLESALAAQQNEKMRLLVKKAALEADIADKTAAHAIDTQAKAITMSNRPVTAPGMTLVGSAGTSLRGYGGGSLNTSLLYAPYNPVQWRMSSKQIIDEARKIMQVSQRLREKSAQLLLDRQAEEAACFADLFATWQETMARIAEVMARTEGEIHAVKGESSAIDGQVDAVGASYGLKQQGLGVVTDRLATRATRPMRELVQDPAQRALANELATLKVHSRTLAASATRLTQDKDSLAKMLADLEETMALKQSSLDIEKQGEPIMAILKASAERLGGSSFISPASLTPGELANVFRSPDKRAISALPANRLSLSRVYATR